ncbi:conserved hypothetical protein [Theileria orientalis strain Shintoku]|uniref:Uncharacterized protein n=1 Tax=Theileria orientalis strain Shintoku TaxID=869250 RepID=J7M4J2_THEOR|nr:conserved hypothetical protein [Theileria orientalis strain Shintoku]BAM38630.1 conserved hypothetical protein [Theileria orientalis strain Shintoku]|eukprot:XP_009688931.1 conserved hypothetical protein [Theileria orientalis strain Shintoku]
MNISRNVLSETRLSTQNFFCDRRINIVTRVRSFTKRIRHHCKIYNNVTYITNNEPDKLTINKLQNDTIDYYGTSRCLIEELVHKCSFLSNHDLVLTLHCLTSIKKPLIKVCSNKGIFSQDGCTTDESQKIISKLLYKCKKTILKHLIESDANKTLTAIQRYYLVIALQKECDLVTFKDWLQLYENISYTLKSNLVNSYKTNEIANLLLIYDQISRYSHKRHKANDKKFNNINHSTIKGEHGSQEGNLKKITTAIESLKERRKYDPFQLDFVNICIHKVEKCLEELKPEKIIKVLYLISTREHYDNNFFQNTIIHLESNKILKVLKIKQVMSLLNTYSRVYKEQAFRYIENYIHDNNSSLEQLIHSGEVDKLDKTWHLNHNKEDKLEKYTGYFNEIDEHRRKLDKVESLAVCAKILIMECVGRISDIDPEIFSNIKGFPDKISEKFEKEHEWKDIIELLGRRLVDIHDSPTHGETESNTAEKALDNINELIKISQLLLKLFKTHRNNDRIKTFQFSLEFFTAVNLHLSNVKTLENVAIDPPLLDKSRIKQLNSKESTDYSCIQDDFSKNVSV